MFKRNKENKEEKIILDKKAAKRMVKEATTALIVINQKDGILNGNPRVIRKCALGTIKALCDRGITSPEDIVGFLMVECGFLDTVVEVKNKTKKKNKGEKKEKGKRGRPKKVSEEK